MNQANAAVKEPSLIESFFASLSHHLDEYEKTVSTINSNLGVQREKLQAMLPLPEEKVDNTQSPSGPGQLAQGLQGSIENIISRFSQINMLLYRRSNDLNNNNVHLFKIL